MLDPYVEGYVAYDVPLNSHTTVYARTGNIFVYALILWFVSVGIWEICRIVLAIIHKREKSC